MFFRISYIIKIIQILKYYSKFQNLFHITQLYNPTAESLQDPLARPSCETSKTLRTAARPVNCSIPYPLHREIVTQSILLLGIEIPIPPCLFLIDH